MQCWPCPEALGPRTPRLSPFRYAFYLQRGMTERAKKYREAARKAVSYDLDYYFNQVDQNPSPYKRW